jgi:hypothetical protein
MYSGYMINHWICGTYIFLNAWDANSALGHLDGGGTVVATAYSGTGSHDGNFLEEEL